MSVFRNPEFWSSQARKTLSSVHALVRESIEYTMYLDYRAALDNEMSLGSFMGRLVVFFDSVWFHFQNMADTKEAMRGGRRWCKVDPFRRLSHLVLYLTQPILSLGTVWT